MRKNIIQPLAIVSMLLCCCMFSSTRSYAQATYTYEPDDQKLHDTIVYLDSVFFHYYNTCNVNLAKYASFYADSLEFYHDKNGLSSSKKDMVNATEKYVCGKVTRHLVKGSIEVYTIKGYGAIEMGLHSFHNNTEPPGSPTHTSKFVIFWQHKNGEWKIAKVVSLH
jgi:hypothetical protein